MNSFKNRNIILYSFSRIAIPSSKSNRGVELLLDTKAIVISQLSSWSTTNKQQ